MLFIQNYILSTDPLIILKMLGFIDLLAKNRCIGKISIVTSIFMSSHCIHRTFLYARLKNGMSSVNTCGGLAGGQPDVSAL